MISSFIWFLAKNLCWEKKLYRNATKYKCICTFDVKCETMLHNENAKIFTHTHFTLSKCMYFSIVWIQIANQQKPPQYHHYSDSLELPTTMDFYFTKIVLKSVATKLNIIGQWISNWVALLPNLKRHYVTASHSQFPHSIAALRFFSLQRKFIDFSLSFLPRCLFVTVNVQLRKKFLRVPTE